MPVLQMCLRSLCRGSSLWELHGCRNSGTINRAVFGLLPKVRTGELSKTMTVVDKLNQMASLAIELGEEWEAEGNRFAEDISSPWVFCDTKFGAMDIDEWAFQVWGLAEAYAHE